MYCLSESPVVFLTTLGGGALKKKINARPLKFWLPWAGMLPRQQGFAKVSRLLYSTVTVESTEPELPSVFPQPPLTLSRPRWGLEDD